MLWENAQEFFFRNGFASIIMVMKRKKKVRKGKERAVRTETVEEDEEILVGSVIAWRITERRRDDGRQLWWWLDPGRTCSARRACRRRRLQMQL
jgi:hypothetical protein